MLRRLTVVLAGVAASAGLAVFGAMSFLASSPGAVRFSARPGQPVHLTVQTVGTIGFGVHPSWVSYLVLAPSGKWTHTTIWQLPAHTRILVTLYQFDTGSPLRDEENGLVTGVTDAAVNGKPVSLVDSYAGDGVGHTFSVPQLGINVPLPGNNADAKNFCNAAPCALAEAHQTVTFSFTTPGAGNYRWQCFIPCGLGFLYGNGGPMQTLGYMDGFLEVA
jgi:hypothetical protein